MHLDFCIKPMPARNFIFLIITIYYSTSHAHGMMLALDLINATKRHFMDILLVEDDAALSSVLTQVIRRWGHYLEQADTCRKVLEKTEQQSFDVVLLDIFLPDGKGYKLIPRLRDVWPGVGIITMTGYNSRKLETEIRKHGILYYMIKPFDTKCLKELLDHISYKSDHKKYEEAAMQDRETIKQSGHILQ